MNGFFARAIVAFGFTTLLFSASAYAGGGHPGRAPMFKSIQGASCQMLFLGEPEWAIALNAQLEKDVERAKTQLVLPNRKRERKDPRTLSWLRSSDKNPVTNDLIEAIEKAENRQKSVQTQLDLIGRLADVAKRAESLPSFGETSDRAIQEWAFRTIESLAYSLQHHEAREWTLPVVQRTIADLSNRIDDLASRRRERDAGAAALRSIFNAQLDRYKPEEAVEQNILSLLRKERLPSTTVIRSKTLQTLTAVAFEQVMTRPEEIYQMHESVDRHLKSPHFDNDPAIFLPDDQIADLVRIARRYDRKVSRENRMNAQYIVAETYRELADNVLSLPLHPRTRQTRQFSHEALAVLVELAINSKDSQATKTVITQFRKLREQGFRRAETGDKILSDEAVAVMTEAMLGSEALTPDQTLGLYDYHLSVAERGTTDVTIAERAVLGRKFGRDPEEIKHLEKRFLMLTDHISAKPDVAFLMREALASDYYSDGPVKDSDIYWLLQGKYLWRFQR